jgi:hypothetical protein
VRIARALESALAPTGAWMAWGSVLESGRELARQSNDSEAEALFLHQLGSRALCLGERRQAIRHLRRALSQRERAANADGAAVTLKNLSLTGGRPGRQCRRRPSTAASRKRGSAHAVPVASAGAPLPAGADAKVPARAVPRSWTIALSSCAAAAAVAAIALMITSAGHEVSSSPALSAVARSVTLPASAERGAAVIVRNDSRNPVMLDRAAAIDSQLPIQPAGARIVLNTCRARRSLAPNETCRVILRVPSEDAQRARVIVKPSGERALTVPIR